VPRAHPALPATQVPLEVRVQRDSVVTTVYRDPPAFPGLQEIRVARAPRVRSDLTGGRVTRETRGPRDPADLRDFSDHWVTPASRDSKDPSDLPDFVD